MQGVFNVSLINNGRHSDEELQSAMDNGTFEDLLMSLDVVEEYHGVLNQLFDNVCAYLMHRLPNQGSLDISLEPTFPVNLRPTNITWSPSCLANICVTSESTDPTYFEFTNEGSINAHTADFSVNTSNAAKKYIADQLTTWGSFIDPSGRESVSFRNRWLYSSSQIISGAIRSITMFFRERPDIALTSGSNTGKIGRVRLKDAGGFPVTLNKTSSQLLLVEHTVTFVSF